MLSFGSVTPKMYIIMRKTKPIVRSR